MRGVVSFLFLLIAHVNAQSLAWLCPGPSSKDHNSTGNPTLKLGSVRTLRWHSTLPSAKIELFQDNGLSVGGGAIKWLPIVTINDMQKETGEYNWTVNADDYDLSLSAIFYLGLTISQRDGSESQFVTSQYVNITASDDTNPICALATASATLPSSSASTSKPSPTTSTSNQSSAASQAASAGGLSSGAIAGISVGCTLLGIAAIAGLVWFLWRRKRRSPANVVSPPAYSDTNPAEKYHYHAEVDGQEMRVEADPSAGVKENAAKDGTRYELGG